MEVNLPGEAFMSGPLPPVCVKTGTPATRSYQIAFKSAIDPRRWAGGVALQVAQSPLPYAPVSTSAYIVVKGRLPVSDVTYRRFLLARWVPYGFMAVGFGLVVFGLGPPSDFKTILLLVGLVFAIVSIIAALVLRSTHGMAARVVLDNQRRVVWVILKGVHPGFVAAYRGLGGHLEPIGSAEITGGKSTHGR
jgi:hypothetical protein